MSSTDQEDSAPVPGDRLYQHSKRKQWGLAVLAWEQEGKRGYQFEDGELRVFAERFYGLLAEVECPPEKTARLLSKLGRASGAGKDGKDDRKLTFDEQLQVFLEEFPESFAGPAWKGHHRGEGSSRRLKRHRDSAAADAQEQLSKEALDELISAGDHAEILRRMTDIVHATDLVTRAQAEPVARAKPSEELSRGLRSVLYGEGEFEPRFDEYCRLLLEAGRKQLSWPLATSIPALVLPEAHVAVRPTVLAKQAQWAYPRLRYSTKPEGRVYTRILTMARTVRDALTRSGHQPKDLLDIYDYMLVTLRPAAQKILDEVRHRNELQEEAAAADEAAAAVSGGATKAAAAESEAKPDSDDETSTEGADGGDSSAA